MCDLYHGLGIIGFGLGIIILEFIYQKSRGFFRFYLDKSGIFVFKIQSQKFDIINFWTGLGTPFSKLISPTLVCS